MTPGLRHWLMRWWRGWSGLQPGSTAALTVALVLLAAVTLLMLPLRPGIGVLTVGLIYLMLISGTAVLAGRRAAVVQALLAFLCFDVLFINPWYTVSVADSDHVLALIVFLGSALLLSHLVAEARRRTVEALQRGREMELLHALSQALVVDAERQPLLERVVQQMQATLNLRTAAVFVRPDADDGLVSDASELQMAACAGAAPEMTRDLHALMQAVHEGQPARGLRSRASGLRATVRRPRPRSRPQAQRAGAVGAVAGGVNVDTSASTDTAGNANPNTTSSSNAWLVLPLRTVALRHGVLLAGRAGDAGIDAVETRTLETFGNQLALALDRVRLTRDLAGAEALARSDALKSALLSAVSHDLRTPLTSIKASATSLLEPGLQWSAEDQRDLLQAIDEEADRLSRIVSNLLDLSRIEAGVLRPQRAWHDLDTVVAEALAATSAVLREHPVTVDLAPELPALWVDHVQMVQVLTNLLTNAARHTPAGGAVTISAFRAGSGVDLMVEDRGPGFPPGSEQQVFEPFVHLSGGGHAGGVGIGLAICRGIVEAHGGTIRATNREMTDGVGGARVTVHLPLTPGSMTATEAQAPV